MITRAKSLLTNEFVEGAFVQGKHSWIVQIHGDEQFRELLVDAKTMGRGSGVMDKNGKQIFQGDIVEILPGTPSSWVQYSVVHYDKGSLYVYYGHQGHIKQKTPLYDFAGGFPFRVIGNVYDNPELVELTRNPARRVEPDHGNE